MKQQMLVVLLATSLVIIGALGYMAYSYAVDSALRISSEAGKRLIQEHKIDLILDVRTDVERNTLGVYPGSVHIQSADLEARMPAEYPNKDIRILAYCNTGHRARMATEQLRKLGYANARYISSTYDTLQ
jgi:rhodanese-related sulfurtransferase